MQRPYRRSSVAGKISTSPSAEELIREWRLHLGISREVTRDLPGVYASCALALWYRNHGQEEDECEKTLILFMKDLTIENCENFAFLRLPVSSVERWKRILGTHLIPSQYISQSDKDRLKAILLNIDKTLPSLNKGQKLVRVV